jgi:hypothetical protein
VAVPSMSCRTPMSARCPTRTRPSTATLVPSTILTGTSAARGPATVPPLPPACTCSLSASAPSSPRASHCLCIALIPCAHIPFSCAYVCVTCVAPCCATLQEPVQRQHAGVLYVTPSACSIRVRALRHAACSMHHALCTPVYALCVNLCVLALLVLFLCGGMCCVLRCSLGRHDGQDLGGSRRRLDRQAGDTTANAVWSLQARDTASLPHHRCERHCFGCQGPFAEGEMVV